jgi:hypothetical protein
VLGFLDEVAEAPVERRPSIGRGSELHLRGLGVLGSGLELDGETVQLSGFTAEGVRRRTVGRIARPSRRSV